jgi:hypothetical protein
MEDFVALFERETNVKYSKKIDSEYFEYFTQYLKEHLFVNDPGYIDRYCTSFDCNCLCCQYNYDFLYEYYPKLYFQRMSYHFDTPYNFAFQWKINQLIKKPLELRDGEWFIQGTDLRPKFGIPSDCPFDDWELGLGFKRYW